MTQWAERATLILATHAILAVQAFVLLATAVIFVRSLLLHAKESRVSAAE